MTIHRPRWESPVATAEMLAGDGERCIRFIQDHCRIDKDSLGGRVGELIELRDWQQLQIMRLLARRDDGRRKHRVGLIGIPRKNGKSGVLSGLALDECQNGPEGGEVYAIAGDKDQAKIVFNTAKRMVQTDPTLAARTRVLRDEIVWEDENTRFRVISSEAATKEGYNPTFVAFDEVHVQQDDELWDVMALAMGARPEPMMLGITTAGDPADRTGHDSLAYRLYQYGVRVASGEEVDPDFFFAWWEPTPKPGAKTIDTYDEDAWAEANPGLGDLVSLEDMRSTSKRTLQAGFRTKRMNIWTRASKATIPEGSWDERLGLTVEEVGGRKVTTTSDIEVPVEWLEGSVVFMDGSWNGDATGIVGCTPDDHLFVVTLHEKKPTDGSSWRVPVSSVEADLRLCMQNGARGIMLDPARWQQSASTLMDEGWPVMEWPTNSLPRMVPAWKAFYDALLDGGFTHDGHPALARHMANIQISIKAAGAVPVKVRPSTRNIDLGICAVGAFANRDTKFHEETKGSKPWSMSI